MLAAGLVLVSGYGFAQQAAQSAPSQQKQMTIFDFKKEIGLTDDQENKLKAVLFDGQSLVNSYKAQLNFLGTELSSMIDKKEDIHLIRTKLTEISKIQIDLTCDDIESGRKINAILTSEQLKKWEEIKKSYFQK
jgi:Spy/CpxP family protein refolding chaperone